MKNRFNLVMFCFVLLSVTVGCSWSDLRPFTRTFERYQCRSNDVPNPRTAGDFVAVSRYHLNDREYDCAYAAAEEALRLERDNARAFSARADAHRGFKEYSAALADYQIAVWLNPNYPDAFYGRSIAYEEIGDLENAVVNLGTAIELAAASEGFAYLAPSWTNQRGFIYLKKGDQENALKDFSAAIALDPENRFFYDDRAKLYRQIGKSELAVADETKSAGLKIKDEEKRSSVKK